MKVGKKKRSLEDDISSKMKVGKRKRSVEDDISKPKQIFLWCVTHKEISTSVTSFWQLLLSRVWMSS